ncbi:hypothetical protein ElyMa_004185500 [Elysia marginata]|uniref:Uncharacterized protein n=1 Tax=Elysia marginata TaxID=1093978 RepID=A0AAV4GJJ4_9GAST|nr:hypothetical protein ElyMa_004185500 [Elysia marginata]
MVTAGDGEELIRNQGKQSIQSQPGKRNTSIVSIAPPRGPKQKSSCEEQNDAILPTITGSINLLEAPQKLTTSSDGEQCPTSLKEATAKGLFQRPLEPNSRPTSSLEGKVVGVQFNGPLPGSGQANHMPAQALNDVPSAGYSTPVRSNAVEASKRSTGSMNNGKFIRTEAVQSGSSTDKTEYTEVGFSDVITPMVSTSSPSNRVLHDMRSEVSDIDEPLF